MTIGVLIVDDQPLLRAGFRLIFEAQDDIEVLGEAGDGEEAVRQAELLAPDVVVMDVRMPVLDGVSATERIVSKNDNIKVLILTTFDLDEYVFSGLRAGASGFLLKNVPPAELLSAIRAIASGDAVVAPSATRRLLDTFAEHIPGGEAKLTEVDPRLKLLTPREHEILIEMATGSSNAEIADRLFLSESTVKTHVYRILGKLNLRDRVQAVVLAYENGVVPRA